MDAAEEITQRQQVCLEKKPLVDGETPPHSPEQAAAVTKVFDDDDLLWEIIVRVGFPTTLVRAALVSKRWLAHASDTKFLSRFRVLHPPCLLGYYHNTSTSPRFVPMLPQPPELAAFIRRTSFSLDDCRSDGSQSDGSQSNDNQSDDSESDDEWVMNSRGSSVFTGRRDRSGLTLAVHNMLCPGNGRAVVPPFPRDDEKPQDGYSFTHRAVLSKEEGGGLSYFFLYMESAPSNILVHVYVLQAGAWHMHTSAMKQNTYFLHDITSLLVDNKIYLAGESRGIMVLDLTKSTFSTVLLPEG